MFWSLDSRNLLDLDYQNNIRAFEFLSRLVMGWVWDVLLGPWTLHKELKGRDTVARQSESFIWIHSREERARLKADKGLHLLVGGLYIAFWLRGTSLTDKMGLFDWQVFLYSHPSQWACPFPLLSCDRAVLSSVHLCPHWVWSGRKFSPCKAFVVSKWDPLPRESTGRFLFEPYLPLLRLLQSIFLPNLPNSFMFSVLLPWDA